MNLDDLDIKILNFLIQNGRAAWADIAQACGLSSPAIAERVKRLEKRQIIQGYTVRLSAQHLGYDLTAFIAVTLERPEHRAPFLSYVQANPAIQECHHVTGEGDYLLKVRCRHTADLEALLSDGIKNLAGVMQTRTSIALSTVKETLAVEVK
jgi:Lrp/AsnC family transcriptional regulator, leucine-responsive regulatory protein